MKRPSIEFAPGETGSTIFFARRLYPYRKTIQILPLLFFYVESFIATYISVTPNKQDFLLRVFLGQLLAVNATMAGLLHFHLPIQEAYLSMIPFPKPRFLLSASGYALIVAGLGIAVSSTQRFAAWLMILLLVAMFPANLMCVFSEKPKKLLFNGSTVAAVIRLPIQVLLIAWSLWLTTPYPPSPF